MGLEPYSRTKRIQAQQREGVAVLRAGTLGDECPDERCSGGSGVGRRGDELGEQRSS
jgi:hypothetical protein